MIHSKACENCLWEDDLVLKACFRSETDESVNFPDRPSRTLPQRARLWADARQDPLRRLTRTTAKRSPFTPICFYYRHKRPFDISFLEPALCSFMFAVFFHAPTVCFACVRGGRMCYSSLVEGGVYNLCGTQSGLSHGLPLCSEAVWPAPVSSSRSQ